MLFATLSTIPVREVWEGARGGEGGREGEGGRGREGGGEKLRVHYVYYIFSLVSLHTERLCLEDYIQLQEIIVPSAVGGVLALLLILIFLAYIIAYIRRRRREAKSQYEPVGDF